MAYRISRNIEASVIDKITADLVTDGWSTFNIRVEKAFSEVYQGTLPCILVQVNSLDPTKLEIGSKTWLKYFEVSIRIFATGDGLRLDLADWMTDKLEDDINYYVYTIVSGVVSTKVLSGKIVVLPDGILRNEKELINTDNLVNEDKYRHIITFRCYIAD